MEARKADPTRGVGAAAVRLTFDGRRRRRGRRHGAAAIRYRLVTLLDLPDEVRGIEIGSLDEGDEVVLLEKRGTYWRVLCPDGRAGLAPQDDARRRRDRPVTQDGDTWTSGDDGPPVGGFEDILRAYTEERRQFGEA